MHSSTATPSCAQRGRQIEHVSGFQHPFLVRRKSAQQLERRVVDQREVALRADPPAAPSESLQQEHVVGVEVRPHPAAGGRVADHQVVQPGVGHEAEAMQQRARLAAGCGSRPGPAVSSRAPRRRKKRGLNGPWCTCQRRPRAITTRDSRLVVAGERDQIARGQQTVKRIDCRAHQQRPLLPVTREEAARRQAAEQALDHGPRMSGFDGMTRVRSSDGIGWMTARSGLEPL